MKPTRILKSKWLWPLWFMLACILLAQGWRAGMATKCATVWSPNRQFKVEYYFYGYVPIWDYFKVRDSYYWPGFTRVTDKDGRVIERMDADNMSSIGNTCILKRADRSDCHGDEKPYEYIGSLTGGALTVVWAGRHREPEEDWKVYWRNFQSPYFWSKEDEFDVETALPAPPED